MLTCAALAAAIATATPGAVLTLAPGSQCENIAIQRREWAKPITIIAEGATVDHLRIADSRGIIWRGGTVTRVAGFNLSGAPSNGVHVSRSANLQFRDMTITKAGRAFVMGRSNGVVIENVTVRDVRAECFMIASSRNVVVRNNRCSGLSPIPRRCTIAAAAPMNGQPAPPPEVRLGTSRRACAEAGGQWVDGDHADAVQLFGSPEGFPLEDILVEGNHTVGPVQCYGMFKQKKDVGSRIIIRNNYCETDHRWAVLIEDCTDCEATGNVARRYNNTPNRTLMQAINSTGRFCGNDNPDARPGNPLTQPCPK